MSTGIKVNRVCKHCSTEFTAQTTVTKYCSHNCSRNAYKACIRNEKIARSNSETVQVLSRSFDEISIKPFLSIAEACKLMGISRRTIYRMIERNELRIAKAGARTILKRSDIDGLFDKPKPIRPKKEPLPVTEFYTVSEVEELYLVKYGRLNNIIKENNIPKTIYNGKLHVSKPHIDRYFKNKRENIGNIIDWYSIEEIQDKYKLTRDQVYARIIRANIPKQRIGKFIRVSKKHFDELFVIGV